MIGGVAQWLGRRSFRDLYLIYSWQVTTLWINCPFRYGSAN